VGSYAEKDLAERLAWLPGVQSVDTDHLDVEPWARDEDVQLGERPDMADADVRTALTRVLDLDPRVRSSPIEVTVEDGTVSLRGEVDNLLAKRAATRDAFNTLGVIQVRDELVVRRGNSSDEEIRASIRAAIDGDRALERGHVEVHVDGGEVRLIGDVASSADYRRVEHIASIAPGVEELLNDVTVNGASPIAASYSYFGGMYRAAAIPSESDREVYEDVRSELFWSPFVDAEQVAIEVDDGIVTLTGAVDSLREKTLAAENAYEGGALVVRNELSTSADLAPGQRR
jgi:osmotically-inducible protein OsmY